MDPDEHIAAVSPLDLPTTESQVQIPTEVWSKIISFLPIDDRCRVEGVNHQLSDAAKATWAQQKSLSIVAPMVDSAAKLATLLQRCGSHLEGITIGRHIQLDTEAQLFQLCPNLKVLTFGSGRLMRGQVSPEAKAKIQSFFRSMPMLRRVQFFRALYQSCSGSGNRIVTLSDMVPSLVSLPNLWELHLPLRWTDDQLLRHIGSLQQIRVLSIMSLVVSEICQLHQLKQLYVRLSSLVTQSFDATVAARLADSLPNLNSFVLVFECESHTAEFIPVGCINAIIGQFAQLRTLVIVCRNQRLEAGSDLVDLSQHRHRQVPLNIFLADYQLNDVYFNSNFTGYSPQINIIPMPNGEFGDALDFICAYRQHGFDFANEKCLQMVKMSKEVGGIWDFAYERE